MKRFLPLAVAAACALAVYAETDENDPVRIIAEMEDDLLHPDSIGAYHPREFMDSLMKQSFDPATRFLTLTEEDYREVAQELGVETAAIKAVVDIEAGKSHQGFWEPGKPLKNFDLTMYRRFAPARGVSLSSARSKSPVIFAAPNARRYGSTQAGQQARFDAAYAIDPQSAIESTFWGMFQIGGFNWRKCGTDSIEQFMELMSRSERDQLELFARFIENNGMVNAIRNHNWLQFALKYNGPKAKQRGYHTRMAAAYRRHKAAEAAEEKNRIN